MKIGYTQVMYCILFDIQRQYESINPHRTGFHLFCGASNTLIAGKPEALKSE